MKCPYCGAETDKEICPKCCAELKPKKQAEAPAKNNKEVKKNGT